jgi:general secretion pathway protein K
MRTNNQEGIILIIVLWVLVILMVIVLSFSVMTRSETYASLAFREGLEKKYIAEAGIERGIGELFYKNAYRGQVMLEEGKKVWRTDGTPYTVSFFNGRFTIRIFDEVGKIDINTLNDLSGIILKNLLINSGVIEQDASAIVDSILDWKDADDLKRLNGAESDYYMSLPKPYKAKNAKFDTLEELLLVKGMNPDILFGGNGKKGIIDFLTIHSNSAVINLISAPREVILAVPGFTAELVEEIISKREAMPPTGTLDVVIPQESSKFVSQAGWSNVHTIESAGYKGEGNHPFAIRAKVLIQGNSKYKFVYYKSPVHLKQ